MKIIIDISEEDYALFKKSLAVGMGNSAMQMIISGEIVKEEQENDK